MPPSSGASPRWARSRLEPLRPPSPSSPRPAPVPPPSSPGFGPRCLQAPPTATAKTRTTTAPRVHDPLIPFPPCTWSCASVEPARPRRRGIIPCPAGQFFLGPTVAVGEVDVPAAGARRREHEVAPVGSPGRILVAPHGGDDGLRTRPVRGGDDDLEAPAGACGVREAVALRGPGRRRVVAAGPRDTHGVAAV